MAISDTRRINWPNVVRKELLPKLSGFVSQGRLLYERPVEQILRGFFIDVSGFQNSVAFVHCLVIPLYVPQSCLSLDFGKRLRMPVTNGERWEIAGTQNAVLLMADVMNTQGLKSLQGIRTPGDLANSLGRRFGSLDSPHTLEALAYSQILGADLSAGLRTLTELQARLSPSVQWERDMAERVAGIIALTSAGKVVDLHEQFETWRRFSMQNLKVS